MELLSHFEDIKWTILDQCNRRSVGAMKEEQCDNQDSVPSKVLLANHDIILYWNSLIMRRAERIVVCVDFVNFVCVFRRFWDRK